MVSYITAPVCCSVCIITLTAVLQSCMVYSCLCLFSIKEFGDFDNMLMSFLQVLSYLTNLNGFSVVWIVTVPSNCVVVTVIYFRDCL